MPSFISKHLPDPFGLSRGRVLAPGSSLAGGLPKTRPVEPDARYGCLSWFYLGSRAQPLPLGITTPGLRELFGPVSETHELFQGEMRSWIGTKD